MEVLGVVANIYRIPKSRHEKPIDRAKKKALRNLIIPVGEETRPKIAEVEAVRYIVEAILPSGEVITKDVSVKKDETLEVELVPECFRPGNGSTGSVLLGMCNALMLNTGKI